MESYATWRLCATAARLSHLVMHRQRDHQHLPVPPTDPWLNATAEPEGHRKPGVSQSGAVRMWQPQPDHYLHGKNEMGTTHYRTAGYLGAVLTERAGPAEVRSSVVQPGKALLR